MPRPVRIVLRDASVPNIPAIDVKTRGEEGWEGTKSGDASSSSLIEYSDDEEMERVIGGPGFSMLKLSRVVEIGEIKDGCRSDKEQ